MTETGYSLSDVAAVTRGNDDWGMGGGGFFWIFALLLLPMLSGGGFWGGNGGAVTESMLCNANSFNDLKNSVGRGFDQQTQFAFQNQRDMCTSTATLSAQIAENAARQEQCCCTTQRAIDGVNFNISQSTAAINANTTAGIQKILDQMCADRAAAQAQRIQQLELNQALCGVVRYPNAVTYSAGANPFFGFNNCGCCGNV